MKTSKLRVTGVCAGKFPAQVPGEFPAQMTSNAENVSIWWRHHDPMVASLALEHSHGCFCADKGTLEDIDP